MNGHKKLVVGGVIAAGGMLGAAALVIGVGIAKADSSSFLTDLGRAGFYNEGGQANELAIGRSLCASGQTPAQMTREVWLNSGLTRDQAEQFVTIVVHDLCWQVA